MLFIVLPMSGSHDVYLVMHPFRDRQNEFRMMVRPLAVITRHLLGVEGFYNPEHNTALVALRFSPQAVQRLGARVLYRFASRSGLPMVAPDTLTAGERRRFFMEHLGTYSVYVQQYASNPDDPPLVERIILSLGQHIEPLPQPAQPQHLILARALPLYGRQRGTNRRLDTAG